MTKFGKTLLKRSRHAQSCLGLLVAGLAGCTAAPQSPEPVFDWREDWAIEEDFALEIDTTGYHFPTAIAFVPEPGEAPQAPLYFVTELSGTVKVITNDRTVHTFAQDFFRLEPEEELPAYKGQLGLAGVCLEPKRGFVFVTFVYQDTAQNLRNNIVRFETEPDTFSLKPHSHITFSEIFRTDIILLGNHQIGPCQIKDDLLYVSVGDGSQPQQSQRHNSTLGKVLRMTLAGEAVSDNPFFEARPQNEADNYVWSYGLRNPFSLKLVDNRLFVADNGLDIDRFMELQPGRNYLWDGSDASIGAAAARVFYPAIGPAQMDYYPGSQSLFPQAYHQNFFIAASTNERGKKPGIVALQYDLTDDEPAEPPYFFLAHRGDNLHQRVVGLAFGPDGLYFSPLLPNQAGVTPVLKISHNPDQAHPFTTATNVPAESLMLEKGCLSCHSLEDEAQTTAPSLARRVMVPNIQTRVASSAYLQAVEALDQREDEPYVTFQAARQAVLTARGEEQVRLWMKYHLMEPRFDDPLSTMPNLGLTEVEALKITDYLLSIEEENPFILTGRAMIRRWLPLNRHRYLIFFGGGLFSGAVVTLLVTLGWRKIKMRPRHHEK